MVRCKPTKDLDAYLDVVGEEAGKDVVAHPRGAVGVHAHIRQAEGELEVDGTQRGQRPSHGVACHIQGLPWVPLY